MFPHRNFKFKNYTDKTVYRYKIVSSENIEDGHVDVSWIDALPISPMKGQGRNHVEPVQEANSTQAFSNAMDQLQTELNDILSSHCNDFEGSDSSGDVMSVKTEKDSRLLSKSTVKSEKPRKLSKCYDFIRQKSGGMESISLPTTTTTDASTSFKIPSQPVKEAFNSQKTNLQSNPKKHRTGRSSKRNTKHLLVTPNKSCNLKEPKLENINDEDRSQALSFLNHVEQFNKIPITESQVNNHPIPITIEVLPQWNAAEVDNPENVVIKVEANSFNYYGDG